MLAARQGSWWDANKIGLCGHTIGDDGDTLSMYYGAADSSIALATASVQRLLSWLHQHGSLTNAPTNA